VPLIAYRYDQNGNLAEVINSSGEPLRYSYDDEGRCVRAEGPGGALSGNLIYDPDNLVITHTDEAGAVTVYQHTPHRRVAAVTNPLRQITRTDYDTYGRLTGRTDALGRTTRWGYDLAGNLTTVTRPTVPRPPPPTSAIQSRQRRRSSAAWRCSASPQAHAQRAWMVRGSNVDSCNLVPERLHEGVMSLSASQLAHLDLDLEAGADASAIRAARLSASST
jgi:YD repeat-containing protein